MKIIDCFTFNNELETLEIRLKLLYDHVDYFILCESNMAHSGKNKPYYYDENKSRYEKYKDKIVHVMIEQSVEGVEFRNVNSYDPTNGSWILEHGHRNSFSLAESVISNNDIVLIGDLDEIPSHESLEFLKNNYYIVEKHPVSFSLIFHYYFLNCQRNGFERIWNGTVAVSGDHFKKTSPQEHRDNRNSYSRLPNAGWHFSYLGGYEMIKTKIESFAHTEFNTPEINNREHIDKCLNAGIDIFNRPDISYDFVTTKKYPLYIQEIMSEYPHLVREVQIN
jgi:beta-1,4-mannosyl-glycoprotein beta-1,4-N-acetylglucosaminyltransferase